MRRRSASSYFSTWQLGAVLSQHWEIDLEDAKIIRVWSPQPNCLIPFPTLLGLASEVRDRLFGDQQVWQSRHEHLTSLRKVITLSTCAQDGPADNERFLKVAHSPPSLPECCASEG